jgi:diacylglycerol kinase family enzyme
VSGETWTFVGIGIAVVFAIVGAVLVLTSRDDGRHARAARPTRATFRSGEDEMPPRKRVAVIVNPLKFDDLDAVRRQLAEVCATHDWDEPLLLETTRTDVGFGQTREALAQQVDLVCALGGDGTVRAVAEELVGSGTPMGLLPGGTGNLLARNLELPVDELKRAMAVALTGRNRRIDAAWLTLDADDPALALEPGVGDSSSAGHHRHAFFVMAGMGLDAAIMDSTSEKLKKRIGWAAYVPSGFQHWLKDRFTVTLTCDGAAPESQRARMLVVGNCGRITGGIDLMPDAEPDDGLLDVIVLTPRGVAAWASVAARVITRSDRTSRDLSRHKCTAATVVVDEHQRVQVDGDIVGEASRFSVEIEPRALIVRTESRKAPAAE